MLATELDGATIIATKNATTDATIPTEMESHHEGTKRRTEAGLIYKEIKNKDVVGRDSFNNVNNVNTSKSKKFKKSSTINRYNPCSSCPALSTKDKRFVDGEGTY